MKYRNLIPELETTISGFADNSKKKNQKMNPDPRFFWHVTVNTHIFFLAPSSSMASVTQNRNIFFQPPLRVWNHLTNLYQTWLEGSFDGLLSKLCPSPAFHQRWLPLLKIRIFLKWPLILHFWLEWPSIKIICIL